MGRPSPGTAAPPPRRAPDGDEDLVETGRPPRRSHARSHRRAGAAAGLAVAVAVGVLAGHATGGPTPAPTPSATPSGAATRSAASGPAQLQLDGSLRCGTLVGDVLSVAFWVHNTGGRPMVLGAVRPVLPLGGLVPLASVTGPPRGARCPLHVLRTGALLPSGFGGWLALGFRKTTACVLPVPIAVDVDVVAGGRTVTTRLLPFPDLAGVVDQTCADPPPS